MAVLLAIIILWGSLPSICLAQNKMYRVDAGRLNPETQRLNLSGAHVENAVATWTAVLNKPRGIALDVAGNKMYWTDSDNIRCANLDGSNIIDLVTTGLVDPRGIALDVAGNKMYWTDSDKIRCANLNGANVLDLVTTGLMSPHGIALDVAGGRMYWAEPGADRIQRANLNGANVLEVANSGFPYGIALDVAGNKMYWADTGYNRIRCANLDGSNIEQVVSSELLSGLEWIALDVAGGKIYWTDWITHKILRVGLDGSNIEALITTGLKVPEGIGLDVAGGKMYWTDSDARKIQRANLDGSNIIDLVTRNFSPPPLNFSSTGIDFGVLAAGTDRDTTITLTNTSDDTLEITNITATDPVFTVRDTTFIIAPGDSAIPTLTFAPVARNPVHAFVIVISNAPTSPDTISVGGAGRTMQTLAIPTDTSTVVYQDADGTVATVRFTAGRVTGHTFTVELFGALLPSSVQPLFFSIPVFYMEFNSTIPDSVSFQASVTLTYTDAQLAEGNKDEKDLVVALFDTTTQIWRSVTGDLDVANNTVTFITDHFSVYALVVAIPLHTEDEQDAVLPTTFALHTNRPNPFNPSTTISYEVSRPAHITLVVYNLLGQEVVRLVDGIRQPGRYTVVWDGTNVQGRGVASGVYVYRMTAGDFTQTKRMTLLK